MKQRYKAAIHNDDTAKAPSGFKGKGSFLPKVHVAHRRFKRKLTNGLKWISTLVFNKDTDAIPQKFQLRTKIRVVLLILFAVVTLIGVLAGYFVQRTTTNTLLMMRENYNSINYTKEMSEALNEMVMVFGLETSTPTFRRQELRKAAAQFERYHNLQMAKVKGEEERARTEELKNSFVIFKANLMQMADANEVSVNLYTVSYTHLCFGQDL